MLPHRNHRSQHMTSLIADEAPEPLEGPDLAEPVLSPAEQAIAGEPETEPTPKPEPESFSREYVQELRSESAKYRTRAKAYDDAFDGYDDDTREAILEWVRLSHLAQNGDADAEAQLEALFGGDSDDASPGQPTPVAEAPEPLSREDVAAIFREQFDEVEAQRAAQEGIAALATRARDMGYDPGSGDRPPSADYILLLQYANRADVFQLDDPIARADEMVKEYKAAIVAEHLGKKEAQASTNVAVPTPGSASQPSTTTRPYDENDSEARKFAKTRDSFEERIRNATRG